jgi:hypothetical protein
MNEMVLWLRAYEESQFQTQLSGLQEVHVA